jgi:hypothetical protein
MGTHRARRNSEHQADEDVLRALAKRGDVPAIVRHVDLRFLVKPESIKVLERELQFRGWAVLEIMATPSGMSAVYARLNRTTEPEAIQTLTEDALEIETRTGARYGGWGTFVKTAD